MTLRINQAVLFIAPLSFHGPPPTCIHLEHDVGLVHSGVIQALDVQRAMKTPMNMLRESVVGGRWSVVSGETPNRTQTMIESARQGNRTLEDSSCQA
jgi:hypothetical protein